jgi:GAF domain-containing protein
MTSTIPHKTTDLERRIAELEAELTRERRAARDQALLYRIAALAVAADDMESFYKGVHDILRELLYAENCYVALYDEERHLLNYAYYVDTDDDDPPDPRAWVPMGEHQAKGVTAYILRTGNIQHQGSTDIQALIKAGELVYEGPLAVDYIGVPLRTGGRTVGVLAVQSYVKGTTYDQADVALMVFVADHIAAALERTRSDAELRQRNAELAIVNEVGQALAKQLDLNAVTELVGERLHATFPDVDLFVALYDKATNLISFPYEIGDNERYHTDPLPADTGLTAEVIRGRRPVLIRTTEEAQAHGAILIGTKVSQSWLGVPIQAGDEIIGVLALEDDEAYAFDENDLRLVSTLGASAGVALRNARLFDETKRLLTETEQRASELSIINAIGAALAEQLDFQSIVDLVGDRLVAMFQARDFYIALHDRQRNLITFP